MEILIGANIRQLRKARDMSQEQLAEAVGVTVQAVSKWETQQSLPDIGIVPEAFSLRPGSGFSFLISDTEASVPHIRSMTAE